MDPFSRTIYVENFPLNTRVDALDNIFKQFGIIRHIEVPTFRPEHPLNKGLTKQNELKTKGYAFIEFQTKAGADEACTFFNDLNHILNNRTVEEPDSNKEPTNVKPKSDIFCDNKYKQYRLLRVMSKKDFKELSRRYDEQRYLTTVKVAKRLIIS